MSGGSGVAHLRNETADEIARQILDLRQLGIVSLECDRPLFLFEQALERGAKRGAVGETVPAARSFDDSLLLARLAQQVGANQGAYDSVFDVVSRIGDVVG